MGGLQHRQKHPVAGWGSCPILELDYKRSDTLLDLSGFALTGSQGCAFCEILRSDIISTWDYTRDLINKNLDDGDEEIYKAKLTVTYMRYQFYEISQDHDEDGMRGGSERVYLDSLYVFFVFNCGGEDTYYRLHYNFHADATGKSATRIQWY